MGESLAAPAEPLLLLLPVHQKNRRYVVSAAAWVFSDQLHCVPLRQASGIRYIPPCSVHVASCRLRGRCCNLTSNPQTAT